jgi:hypothetical protein
MKALAIARRVLVAASLALLGAPVAAQSGSTVQETAVALANGYARITALMDSAGRALAADAAGALINVEDAQAAFDELAPRMSNELAGGAKAAFTSARAAVGRRSEADLTAQSLQTRAILARAMLDALLSEPNDRSAAATLAKGIASATAMGTNDATNFASAAASGDASRARLLLEQHQATVIERALGQAANGASAAAAFQATARAAGAFLVVQDSPNAGRLSANEFSTLLARIASGDIDASRDGIARLRAAAQSFKDLSGAVSTNPSSPPSTQAVAPTRTDPAPTQAATATPSVAPVVRQGRPAPGSAVATLDTIKVRLASAYARAANNDPEGARELAEQAAALFVSGVQPVLAGLDRERSDRAGRLFAAVPSAANLLAPDVGVLLVEADGAREALLGRADSGARQNLAAAMQPAWAGWLRGLLFLVTAALFAYPVYLMNLSFGGRNPHWRLVSVALLLLFLAPVLESVAWLARQVAVLTGADFLFALSGLSILNNPLAQVAWAASLLVAVALATLGFRGIAAQFGLLRGHVVRNATVTENAPAMAGAAAPINKRPSTETVVEWDEEL